MKYSIRTKLIVLILTALILPALIIGGLSIYFTNKLTDEYAHENVSLMCEKNASEINDIFASLEKSVDYMSINALEEMINPMNLADEIYYKNYMDKMSSIIWNTSNHTNGAIAVYLRFNPEICGYTAGVFMTRESIDSEMKSITTTDLSAYDESDDEHVGWYYKPLKAKRPIWLTPYYNQNIGVYMISYVVPMYKDDTTVGVMGMDINFNAITEQVANIKAYKSGYAYITDREGKVVYHPTLEYGDTVQQKDGWWNSECNLNNGMVLNITAPESEIEASRDILLNNIIIVSIAFMVIFILMTLLITNRMIAPLEKLNQIAIKISEENYDVDFNFKRPHDEIGQLTTSFEHTVATLKEYMAYMNGLAYKDSLTGVRNRTAYNHQVSMLEESLSNGEKIEFAIAVFDINNLKNINDNLGHECGDELIKGACKLICHTFKQSAVFRIGGDEFVAVIKDMKDAEIKELFALFENEMKKTWSSIKPENRISIAYGFSSYDSEVDACKVEPVFNRADEIMYENKKAMKAKKN